MNLPTVIDQIPEGWRGKFRVWEPGMKITEPGAYLDMPMNVYHGQPCDGPSVSSSGLRKIFLQSPAHFYHTSSLNPKPAEDKDSNPMILGRAAHHLLFGEKDFNRFFVTPPARLDGEAWHPNRKACREWIAMQMLDGMTVLKPDMMEKIRGMSESLSRDPIVQGGILNGLIEVSIFWKDPETDIWLKVRPDAIPNDSGDFGDLKCVSSVSTEVLERALGERGYHQQGALVGEVSAHVLDLKMENFGLVYVEADAPHCVRVGSVDHEDLARGEMENRAALRLLRRCMDTGYWPGPRGIGGDGGFVRRTKWMRDTADARMKIIEQELAQ